MIVAVSQAWAQTQDSVTVKPPARSESADLAQQLQNPIANLISLPFQSNHDYGLGENRGYKHTLNIQPVIPISISTNWNIIVRVILPVISQNDVIGETEQDGIGDMVNSFFISPKLPGKGGIIWGVGPVFLVPSASDKFLGTEKLGLGPTLVALKQKGPWTVGILTNQIWSVAGVDEREEVSAFYFQPFVSHTNARAFTIGISSEDTYNWKSDDLTGGIFLNVSQLVKYRQQPISLGVSGKVPYGPDGTADWGWRFVMTFLFPTGK